MIKLVVMDKGFVSVGKYTKTKEGVKLEHAAVVRYWGTSRGLGEIAENGPTDTTRLDKTPTEMIPWHAVIKTIDCDESKWREALGIKKAKK
jgi:hypothetical protein